MDPAKIKVLEDTMNKGNEKLFGPMSEEFKQYLNSLPKVDHSDVIAPTSHSVQLYSVNGCCINPSFIRGYFEGKDINLTKDDIVLASYPKTGTTWVQKMTDLILSDADIATSNSQSIDERVPYLEWPECTMAELKARPSPKFIKTHLPYDMLPTGSCDKKYKIIYATRNPKDTAVSLYHFYKMIPPLQFVGEMNDILNLFLHDKTLYSPFGKHALGYWNRRNDDNVLFVKYEDLQKDLEGGVRRIAKFLGKNLTDDKVKIIVEATTFKSMAKNKAANHDHWEKHQIFDPKTSAFMRKGQVGDWKNHFDEEMKKKFDDYIDRNFKGTGLTYDYE